MATAQVGQLATALAATTFPSPPSSVPPPGPAPSQALAIRPPLQMRCRNLVRHEAPAHVADYPTSPYDPAFMAATATAVLAADVIAPIGQRLQAPRLFAQPLAMSGTSGPTGAI